MASTIKDVARLAGGIHFYGVPGGQQRLQRFSSHPKKGAAGDQGTELYTQHRGTQLGGAQPENIAVVMGRTMDQAFSNPDFSLSCRASHPRWPSKSTVLFLLTDLKQSMELEHCIKLIRSGAVQGVIVVGSFRT